MIPFAREKIKVRLAITIPTGAPTAKVNETIDISPVVALKTINILCI